MASSTTIYCVYKATVDLAGYLQWDFDFAASSLERAKEIIIERAHTWCEPVHPSMNHLNHYTFVGTRRDAGKAYNREDRLSPYVFKGWVIEAQTLQ